MDESAQRHLSVLPPNGDSRASLFQNQHCSGLALGSHSMSDVTFICISLEKHSDCDSVHASCDGCASLRVGPSPASRCTLGKRLLHHSLQFKFDISTIVFCLGLDFDGDFFGDFLGVTVAQVRPMTEVQYICRPGLDGRLEARKMLQLSDDFFAVIPHTHGKGPQTLPHSRGGLSFFFFSFFFSSCSIMDIARLGHMHLRAFRV